MRGVARPLFIALAAVVVAVAVDLASQQTRVDFDLTADRSLSLTAQTESIAGAVDRRTTITAFLRPDDPERSPAAALLLRYQRINDRIRFRILDPRSSAGELRRLGIDPGLGGVAVSRGDAVEVVPTITEQDLTGALARLARGRSAQACFTTGHGESAIGDEGPTGFASAAAALTGNGYRLQEVDLLAGDEIPTACDAVVVAGPLAPMGPAAAVLRKWMDDHDGRLLLMADPAGPPDESLREIVAGLGLGLRRGIVLEGDAELVLPDDPTAPIVRSYPSSSPIVRRLPPTFFPGLQQVEVAESNAEEGLTVTSLAQSSEFSYLETEPLTSTFDVNADVRGPITIAAAGDRVRLAGDDVRRSRGVVVGDVDFATNAAIGQAANSAFLVRAMDWLSLDEQLVVLSANIPKQRPLTMTAGRVAYARFVSLALLPGLLLLAGAAVWLLRRSR